VARCAASASPPWTGQVKGVGCGYWRMVGSVEALIVRAQASRQRWMKGIGYARKLTATRAKGAWARWPGFTLVRWKTQTSDIKTSVWPT